MPISLEQFNSFQEAEIEEAAEIAKTFISEINSPMELAGPFGIRPLVKLCCDKDVAYKKEKLKLLLDLGADPNAVANYYGSALMQSLQHDLGGEFIKVLLDAKANINLPDEYGRTAVFVAVQYRRFDDLRILFSRGANLNHKANNGDTALTEEIVRRESNIDVVKLLIELGADVNTGNNLHAALEGWDLKALHIVETLIDFGANVNAKYDDGTSPLALAVSKTKCPISTIEMLVKAGAGRRIVRVISFVVEQRAAPGGRTAHANASIGAEAAHLGKGRTVRADGDVPHLGVGDASRRDARGVRQPGDRFTFVRDGHISKNVPKRHVAAPLR